MTAEPKVGWGPCCFCGQPIADSEHNPCRVTVETRKEKWQVWFCHAECFRSRLAPDTLFEPAHF